MRNFIQITITKKGENRARMGHPWVFEGEVLKESEKPENGSLVDVVSEKGKYIGTGFYNDHSKIRVRLLSYNANDRFDEAFFERRVRYAVDYRKTVMPGADFACCRLIFGEADGFPGLTVDRFDDVLVAQVLSLGMERHKNQIFSLLLRVLREMGERVKGVYERNDVKIRELEGMSEKKGIAQIPENELTEADLMPIIVENGLSYMVDVVNGQKTGFFLDQKYNRQAVARIAKGFGMEIYAFDAFCPKEVIEKDGVKAVGSAEELYSTCDVVSLHIPATAETKNSINYALVNKMPKGGLLVNTARKEVINEAELIQLMEERTDLKYMTDIMPAANETFAAKFAGRYFSTPKKMGAQTAEANINAGIAAAKQIVGFLKDGCEKFRVNK